MKWVKDPSFRAMCPCVTEIVKANNTISQDLVRMYFMSFPYPQHVVEDGKRVCSKDKSYFLSEPIEDDE